MSPQRASPPLTATIEIDAGTVEDRISPLLYGQFIEFMFEGIKGGLHAELIRNRGFEGEPTDAVCRRALGALPGRPQRRLRHRVQVGRDAAYPARAATFEGHVEPDIAARRAAPGVVARHGVYQARVPVRQGLDYRGSLWIKTDAFDGRGDAWRSKPTDRRGRLRRSLHRQRGGRLEAVCVHAEAGASDPLARFAILFTGQGTVWVDQVSLMPGDAVGRRPRRRARRR